MMLVSLLLFWLLFIVFWGSFCLSVMILIVVVFGCFIDLLLIF